MLHGKKRKKIKRHVGRCQRKKKGRDSRAKIETKPGDAFCAHRKNSPQNKKEKHGKFVKWRLRATL
jgi:hypothetical protein